MDARLTTRLSRNLFIDLPIARDVSSSPDPASRFALSSCAVVWASATLLASSALAPFLFFCCHK